MGRNETQIMMYNKKKLNMKKQKIRDETLKTYIDSKEI